MSATPPGDDPDSPRRWLLRLGAAAALFGSLALWSGGRAFQCAASATEALVGRDAPAFSGEIVSGPGADEHDRVALESLRGRPVLLDFWASWCDPCRASIPVVNRLHERFESRGLVTIGVNIESGAPVSRVIRAHRTFGARFPAIQDADYAIQSSYLVESIPTLVLVDREGVIRHVEVGVPAEQDLAARIEEILE